MKLSVSNIAWRRDEEWLVADALTRTAVGGVEIAPPRVWDAPATVTSEDASAYRQEWARRRLPVVALQSLLYGREDLVIFGSAAMREATLDYLRASISLARDVGAHALVFGSPVNRQVGDLPAARAMQIAAAFFSALGEAASAAGAWFCIEPNPPEYRCDFLRTTAECVDFLAAVDAPGLGLHLDAGAITLNEEPVAETVELAAPWLRHFHISEPYLGMIGSTGVAHEALASALAAVDYSGWVSIEMRAAEVSSIERVVAAIDVATRLYAPLLGDDSPAP